MKLICYGCYEVNAEEDWETYTEPENNWSELRCPNCSGATSKAVDLDFCVVELMSQEISLLACAKTGEYKFGPRECRRRAAILLAVRKFLEES